MQITYTGKEQVAEGTMLFRFQKPDGFAYKAGQSIDLAIPNMTATDPRGNMRPFTLSSAPHESDLYVTTRMTGSPFKETLAGMEPGAALEIEGPFGDLTLHENVSRPAVFLAGGIGVTPFHSMALDAAHRALPHSIVLFYSNRRPEDAPFLSELLALEKQNQNFTLVATMTEMEKSSQAWEGERGYVTIEMIDRHVSRANNPLFYIAGPAAMVAAMRAELNGAGVSGDDIRTEEFTGY